MKSSMWLTGACMIALVGAPALQADADVRSLEPAVH